MPTPATVAKHPIHPMLIPFPIGLWTFSLICDFIYLFGEHDPIWNTVALYSGIGGLLGAALAAIPGLIDYFSIHEREMKRIATLHLFLNSSALIAFGVSMWLHTTQPWAAFVLSLLGIVLIGIGGWLGGEMVYVKGMAVEAVDELSRQQQGAKKQPVEFPKAS
jgi:uncharacterized membrane protein